jgi:hypothetical protein
MEGDMKVAILLKRYVPTDILWLRISCLLSLKKGQRATCWLSDGELGRSGRWIRSVGRCKPSLESHSTRFYLSGKTGRHVITGS